jgi:imidazole glycerol-phosphate synthase subunit HisF
MLRNRVIPIVLLDGYSVLKTIRFDVRRNLGNPITVARVYNTRDVDELILLDIDASKEDRKIDLYTIQDIALECFMPLTVGGGIRTCQDIEEALAHGADKVALNTVIFENPQILNDSVKIFGSQCIVASIDIKKNDVDNYSLFSHAGKRSPLSLSDCIEFLNQCEVGEILINSVDCDGTMTGYDLALIKYASGLTNIPIIFAGGASSADDCAKAIKSGASAVAAASIFHFTSITPLICKQAMHNAGIPVRI